MIAYMKSLTPRSKDAGEARDGLPSVTISCTGKKISRSDRFDANSEFEASLNIKKCRTVMNLSGLGERESFSVNNCVFEQVQNSSTALVSNNHEDSNKKTLSEILGEITIRVNISELQFNS